MMQPSSIEIGRSGFSGYRRIGLGELKSPRPDIPVICFCEVLETRWYTSVNTGNLKAWRVGASALELSAMAKTKRRQLAALAAQAAQAELKELPGDNERISSGTKSGPSGAVFQAGDPNVEIRTQRVIFKIPALPPKPPPAADTQQPPGITKKEVFGKRRRKKPAQVDIEPSSEQVPADEAKISKGIVQFGKWKRHKKIRDLLPTGGAKAVPSSGGLSNGSQSLPVAKPMENGKLQNGQLHLPVRGPQKPSKKRVKPMTGSRKRAKVQEVIVRSPPARDESKLSKTQVPKLQEVGIRSPVEKLSKFVKTQGKSSKTEESALDRPASALGTSKRRSRDLFVKDTDRSEQLAIVGDVDSPSSLAHIPPRQKRRRGNAKKATPQVPVVVNPNATALVSHHRTRSRAKISYCEAMALEVLQEIRNVKKTSSQRMENLGKIAEKGRMSTGSAGDGGPIFATRDQSEANAQNSENVTSPQEKEQFPHDSSSNEVLPSNLNTSHHNCSQGDPRGGLKSQLHRPFAKQGLFLVDPNPGKVMGKSTAEIIKQDSQLTIMQKRLEAAGGLRNWLLKNGLEQVLPFLEEWNLDNLSLMQLTMEGLKSMGLIPVGPRRKLIHAISSLTLPSFPKRSVVHANGG